MIAEENKFNVKVLNCFTVLQKKNRLAHAYLFVGPMDVGKGETARVIAKMLNCEGDIGTGIFFCDQCHHCVKINTGNHPDIHVIDNEVGESIKIDQIRGLLSQMKLRAFQARKKIFILRNIENLTLESSNALLKTLEEPSAETLLILTTSVSEKILATIKSRCHIMSFVSSSRKELFHYLQQEDGETAEDAHFLAYFSEGCLGKARRLKKNRILKQKESILEQFILSGSGSDFLKKTLTDKKKTRVMLDVLLGWTRDALLVKSGVQGDRLIHREYLSHLKRFSENQSFNELKELYDEVVKTCRLLADNLNVKIPLLIIKEKLNYG